MSSFKKILVWAKFDWCPENYKVDWYTEDFLEPSLDEDGIGSDESFGHTPKTAVVYTNSGRKVFRLLAFLKFSFILFVCVSKYSFNLLQVSV